MVRYTIYLKAGSSKREVQQRNTAVHVWVKSPRKYGKANQEMIELLAKYFGVSTSKIFIVSGEKNTQKIVEILS